MKICVSDGLNKQCVEDAAPYNYFGSGKQLPYGIMQTQEDSSLRSE